MEKIYFQEEQHLKNYWIWISIFFSGLGIVAIFAVLLFRQVKQGEVIGNNPMTDTELIITSILTISVYVLIFLLLRLIRLITIISDQGIQFKYFPFHLKFHEIKKSEIESYDVITYKPIRDYGGWGIKIGKNGKAYNVYGNQGLIVKLTSGKKVLFGTQRNDAVQYAMKKMMENS